MLATKYVQCKQHTCLSVRLRVFHVSKRENGWKPRRGECRDAVSIARDEMTVVKREGLEGGGEEGRGEIGYFVLYMG